MSDAVIAVIAVVILVLPFALARLWHWVGLILSIAGVVALWEGIAIWSSGLTVSKQFWAFSLAHPILAWGMLGLLGVAWVGFLLHLAWKMLRKK